MAVAVGLDCCGDADAGDVLLASRDAFQAGPGELVAVGRVAGLAVEFVEGGFGDLLGFSFEDLPLVVSVSVVSVSPYGSGASRAIAGAVGGKSDSGLLESLKEFWWSDVVGFRCVSGWEGRCGLAPEERGGELPLIREQVLEEVQLVRLAVGGDLAEVGAGLDLDMDLQFEVEVEVEVEVVVVVVVVVGGIRCSGVIRRFPNSYPTWCR